MESNISVAPPLCHFMCLHPPEPLVAPESRPCCLSPTSQSSEHESRPHHSPKHDSRHHHSSERESRPHCSPEDENIGEYFITCSPLYFYMHFLYKINTLFLFLFLLTTFLIICINNSSSRLCKEAYYSSCYEVNILASL